MNEKKTDKSIIMDGKEAAAALRREIRSRADALKRTGTVPGLAVILVGDDPASVSYVTAKQKGCAEVGIDGRLIRLPSDTPQERVIGLIDELGGDRSIHGILAQLPLPSPIDEQAVTTRILPEKDVDGFHPYNVGQMLLGDFEVPLPCTPHGIIRLLRRCNVETAGREAVIVGRSNIVGKPLAAMLGSRNMGNATVTLCHSATRDLAKHVRRAEILVAAAGSPGLITGDMVSEGCVVIDVGTNRIDAPERKRGWKLAGDVDFDSVARKAAMITPVPGGVGPMTVTMLLENTVRAAEKATGAEG